MFFIKFTRTQWRKWNQTIPLIWQCHVGAECYHSFPEADQRNIQLPAKQGCVICPHRCNKLALLFIHFPGCGVSAKARLFWRQFRYYRGKWGHKYHKVKVVNTNSVIIWACIPIQRNKEVSLEYSQGKRGPKMWAGEYMVKDAPNCQWNFYWIGMTDTVHTKV